MTRSDTRASQPRPTLSVVETSRAFRLSVHPADRGDAYGVSLDETYGDNGHTLATPVITTTAGQTGRVIDAVLAAVRSSGHASSAIAFTRKAPIRLDEAAGVRLALTLLTTQPVSKHDRVRALVAGINAMSVEETYYWYAKCLGSNAPRARKALRVLLSDA
ncbi:DUF7680 family protein [Micromonospora luteifusca]|uniref:DUF7680 family protein n=1 Tax=Micromonospora luteifusca TaxID=709860 RepID=UPI00339EF36E